MPVSSVASDHSEQAVALALPSLASLCYWACVLYLSI